MPYFGNYFGPASAGAYPTAGEIADAVWDEARAGHVAPGSFGAVTEWASTGGLDAAGVRTAVGLASANLDTQLGAIPTLAEVQGEFAALADDTDIATAAAAAILATPANKLATDASGRVEVASATDKNTLDALLAALQGAGWTDETLASLDGLLDAIKAKTDNLPASPAAVGSQMDLVPAPNATAVTALQSGLSTLTVADIIAGISEGSLDLQEMLRIILAAAAGKASGGGTTEVTFRDQADTKDRIVMTLADDDTGDRLAVTVDGS